MMNTSQLHTPLSNVQVELLKLFPADIPETHLAELRKIIARFLLDKARDSADAIWDKNDYSDEKLQQMLNNK